MKIPSWLSWYKKPEYRDIKEYSNAIVSGRRPLSPVRTKQAIPKRLQLERVLENKTCSPMSLYDFYMYLKYIEFSPENLEFYIWFKHYEATWQPPIADKDSKASSSSRPSWDGSTASLQGTLHGTGSAPEYWKDPEIVDTMTRITDMISTQAMCEGDVCKPAFVLPQSKKSKRKPFPPADPAAAKAVPETTATEITQPLARTATLNVVDARGAGPRAELQAVVHTFLQPGAEKELNIPPAMRATALAALATSTDPAHLRPVADHVYLLLRNCSHRNFVRLGVSNGTFETLCMATGLGIVLTLAGLLCVLLRAFTPARGAHSRFDVFAAWPLWWVGLSLVLSGLRGSCFFLLLFTRRQPLPWERYDDSAGAAGAAMVATAGGPLGRATRLGARLRRAVSRLMIFDRKMRVKDTHLRRLQHRIVLQSMGFGALFATLGVCVFIFLPVWSETYHR